MNKDRSMTFFCLKYNTEDGTCQVRKTNTCMRQILKAKCRAVKDLLELRKCFCPRGHESVHINQLIFNGMIGRAVLGHVKFSYEACIHRSFYCCVTAFTIDLEKVFGLLEPASSFAAIDFPLENGMLAEKPNVAGFCNYYKSVKDGVKLVGLVELEGELQPELATIHSFESALQLEPI